MAFRVRRFYANRLLRAVPVHDFDPVSRTSQVFADFLSHHDRTVLPTGAAKSDRKITLSFMNVVGQQIN